MENLLTGGIYNLGNKEEEIAHGVIIGQNEENIVWFDLAIVDYEELTTVNQIVNKLTLFQENNPIIQDYKFFELSKIVNKNDPEFKYFSNFITGYLGTIPNELLEYLRENARKKYPYI